MSLPLRQLACIAAIALTLLCCIVPNLVLVDQDSPQLGEDLASGKAMEDTAAAFAVAGDDVHPPYGVFVCAPIMLLGLLATLPIFIKAFPRK